jgi:hypothetical protein
MAADFGDPELVAKAIQYNDPSRLTEAVENGAADADRSGDYTHSQQLFEYRITGRYEST